MTNGDKLGRMDLGSFFGPKTEIEPTRLDPVFGQKRANREAEAPYLPSDRKERAFREFGKLAVLSTFSAQKGAVTLNDDIGKTFSRMGNLAVLAAFLSQKRKLIREYRPVFLTTAGTMTMVGVSCCIQHELIGILAL